MPRFVSLPIIALAALAGSACATGTGAPTIALPTGPDADLLYRWEAVERLHKGTHVLVEIEPSALLDARVIAASDADLTIRWNDRPRQVTRASVVRVVRIQSLVPLKAGQGALAGGVLGLAVTIATGGFVAPLLIDPALFGGMGAALGVGESRQILVYERGDPGDPNAKAKPQRARSDRR